MIVFLITMKWQQKKKKNNDLGTISMEQTLGHDDVIDRQLE